MVKPALAYLDIIRRVADSVTVPVAAYQVSGEFAMVEAAAANGWLDRDRIIIETLTAIRRAGASVILTYWAAEVARLLGRWDGVRAGHTGNAVVENCDRHAGAYLGRWPKRPVVEPYDR